MQGIKPETLSDEEFMRYAYLQGLGKLDETWVKQFYDRLQRAMDDKASAEELEEAYEQGYEEGRVNGYSEGYDEALSE